MFLGIELDDQNEEVFDSMEFCNWGVLYYPFEIVQDFTFLHHKTY